MAAFLLLAAVGGSRADSGVAQFAGAQLGMAEAALEQGRLALRVHDYAAARRFAAQAALDARLAWNMTRSEVLRRAALEVSRRAEQLRFRGLMAAGTTPP